MWLTLISWWRFEVSTPIACTSSSKQCTCGCNFFSIAPVHYFKLFHLQKKKKSPDADNLTPCGPVKLPCKHWISVLLTKISLCLILDSNSCAKRVFNFVIKHLQRRLKRTKYFKDNFTQNYLIKTWWRTKLATKMARNLYCQLSLLL